RTAPGRGSRSRRLARRAMAPSDRLLALTRHPTVGRRLAHWTQSRWPPVTRGPCGACDRLADFLRLTARRQEDHHGHAGYRPGGRPGPDPARAADGRARRPGRGRGPAGRGRLMAGLAAGTAAGTGAWRAAGPDRPAGVPSRAAEAGRPLRKAGPLPS